MRRALLFVLPLALAACTAVSDRLSDYSDKSGHSASFVVPVALATPPLNNILVGPCTDEFAVPDGRKTNCNLHHKVRGQTSPWNETTARAQAMSYGPGELQCWRTLGTSECAVIAGPPRSVYIVGPNMGAN